MRNIITEIYFVEKSEEMVSRPCENTSQQVQHPGARAEAAGPTGARPASCEVQDTSVHPGKLLFVQWDRGK